MNVDYLYAWCVYALCLPFLIITAILAHYLLLRLLGRWHKRSGKGRVRFYPSAFAFGLAFQSIQIFHRPSMSYVVEARRNAEEDADEDDNGDGDTRAARLRHFHRQLRRIRRGEPIDRLVLRM